MLSLASAELLIVLALLNVARKQRGAEWCRKRGVGKMRETIARPLPPGVLDADPSLATHQKRAVRVLEAHCVSCRKCALAEVTGLLPRAGTDRDGVGAA